MSKGGILWEMSLDCSRMAILLTCSRVLFRQSRKSGLFLFYIKDVYATRQKLERQVKSASHVTTNSIMTPSGMTGTKEEEKMSHALLLHDSLAMFYFSNLSLGKEGV